MRGRLRIATTCSVPGCGKPHLDRRYCRRHYMQIVRDGGRLLECDLCGEAFIAAKGSAMTHHR
jgi:hypothetical protein